MVSLMARAFAVWLLFLVAAIVNGTVRQAVLLPLMGEQTARFVSTVVLSGVIFGVGWLMSGFLDLVSSREAWFVGALWLGLTVAFEFLAGHAGDRSAFGTLIPNASKAWILSSSTMPSG